MIAIFDRLIARIRIRKWIAPEKPCGSCGEFPDRLIAHHTGDGWLWAWECPNYCGWMEEFPSEWPWLRSFVWGRDWEAIGVEIV